MVQGGARVRRVVLFAGRALDVLVGEREQALVGAPAPGEGRAAGLERQGHRHLGVGVPGECRQHRELDAGEIVEPVEKGRSARPVLRPRAQCVERPPGEEVGVHHRGRGQRVLVGGVERGDLGALPPRRGRRQRRRADQPALELAEQLARRAREPR